MSNNENENNEIVYEDLVEVIELESEEDLNKVKDGFYPDGRKFPINLKKHCIFRGVSDVDHELIPKALRKNKENGEYEICDYINSSIFDDYRSTTFQNIECQKDEKLSLKLQYKREFFVLFRFLDWADKSGLKIPVSTSVRKLLHSHINHFPGYWPKSEFYEVISLAQHYELPTCALDWSYDYKVALYFAVKNVLKEKDKDEKSNCVLWAFNYKNFEKYSTFVVEEGLKSQNKSQLRFYRPKYYNNPNLKAQKGLFTFLINKPETFNEHSLESLDNMVLHMVQESGFKNINSEIEVRLCGIKNFTLKDNEKIFYKFIIPGEYKSKILKKLYLDGYSEEYLFPGYKGVADAMKNRIALEKVDSN